MRPIARQSARLASQTRAPSCSRIRQPSLPRIASASAQHQRSFHRSVQRASDAKPPGDNSHEHNAWIERHRAEEQSTAPPEHTKDADNAEAKSNGNGNGEGRKTRMRRSMRNGRNNEVPRPPPIPQWFMKHNVTLVRDVQPEALLDRENAQIIRCVDTETGHTLFTVPYYQPTDSRQANHHARDPHVVDIDDQKVDITALGIDRTFFGTLPKEAHAFWVVNELVHQRSKGPHEVDLQALGELLVSLPRKQQEHVLKTEAENREAKVESNEQSPDWEQAKGSKSSPKQSTFSSFFNQKLFTERPQPAEPLVKEGEWTAFQSPQSAGPTFDLTNPQTYVFLEAEASIRAGLSMATEGQQSSSFASNRVDVSLHCPDSDSHDHMDEYVRALAQVVHADLIRIDANDIEDLTAEYVGNGSDTPGSFSTLGYDVFDGYEASSGRNVKPFGNPSEDDEIDMEEDDYDEEDEESEDRPSGGFGNMEDLRKALHDRRHELGKALQGIGIAGITIGRPQFVNAGSAPSPLPMMRSGPKPSSSSEIVQYDEARLTVLLEGLLEASTQKRERLSGPEGHKNFRQLPSTFDAQSRIAQAAETLVNYMSKSVEGGAVPLKLETQKAGSLESGSLNGTPGQKTIIHLRDLKDLSRSHLGDAIVRKLVRIVQKKRRSGESVLIVGTTAQGQNNIFMSGLREPEDFPFRTITVPPPSKEAAPIVTSEVPTVKPAASAETLKNPGYRRILEINLRHVQSMLRRLRPSTESDLLSHEAREQMSLQGSRLLSERVLTLDEVQRVVLTAVGLSRSYAQSEDIKPVHVALAAYTTMRVDEAVQNWNTTSRLTSFGKKDKPPGRQEGQEAHTDEGLGSNQKADRQKRAGSKKIEEVKKNLNQHETKLLTGVADSQNIRTGFDDVHATPETIEALKTLTTLSLMRPEAFSYGVLASDRLPGLMLYGPPGTGKTLLAKAVAKESGATVLEISGAQIYEKYVGEGEKMVRAVFSLAKKLSPCVVFIDEADAIFGSRSGAGNRNTHREIINQFLREWDGMDDHGVFMMVASNRPFDLDDAVLRRLPRRLLVDLPVAKDRESILGIHLKNEALDDSVSLANLAEQTPLYSGSDLKNLCVSAALACVREENDLIARNEKDGNADFKLPEKRTLAKRHFDKAVQEISASISEDMASLNAIRKFDEQYGDRKGRKKKSGYGFGMGEQKVDESSVRVRAGTGEGAPSPP
ncbi:AAA-domain-containing protein [Hortaea werneckii]|nr:AAA-domain-containing protein [Hortaea werneckii]